MARDTLVPNYAIQVNGTPLKEGLYNAIQSVEVERELGMVDVTSIKVSNLFLDETQKGTGRERMSDSKLFAEGNVIDVFGGYGDELEHVGHGVIQSWLPNFPKAGMPIFTIRAYGEGQDMMRPRKGAPNQWRNATHDVVVKEICSQIYKYDVSEVAPSSNPAVKQIAKKDGISDYDFINELAKKNAYEFWVTWDEDKKRNKVIWGPPQKNQGVTFNLFYDNGDETTLFSFDPYFQLAGQSTGVELMVWSRTKNVPILVIVLPTDKKAKKNKFSGGQAVQAIQEQISNGDDVMLATYGNFVRVITSNSAFSTADQAKAIADSVLSSGRYAFMYGRAQTIGLEVLLPRQVVELQNLGNRFSGKYYVRSIRHTFSKDSFTTNFVVWLLNEFGM